MDVTTNRNLKWGQVGVLGMSLMWHQFNRIYKRIMKY